MLPSKPLGPQEVLNSIVAYAEANPTKCKDSNGTCAFRDRQGNKCFIGVLIPDEIYTEDLERLRLPKIVKLLIEREVLVPEFFFEDGQRFLSNLQAIHDFSAPNLWRYELKDFAQIYSLEFPQ
jgi:hypothetical protein